ncbi:peroxisomal membrane protein PMP34-like, partial [Hyposmocoma kahamanoa]|uniref:peroxisomal membrane protein PMP34-like n=1 Tax=Hyposmocoma kahamanoa TaxID=1477025 RepID=UPI000E6D7A54
MQTNTYTNLFQGLYQLYRKEGAKGLWSGTIPSLLLVTNPAMQFMVYESLKRTFLAGAVAKSMATTMTYPIQLVQPRLRAGTGLKPLVKDVKDKPSTLFRGLEAKLLQTVMTAALIKLDT